MPDDTCSGGDATLPERLRAVVALACAAAARIESLESELAVRNMRIAAMERETARLRATVAATALESEDIDS